MEGLRLRTPFGRDEGYLDSSDSAMLEMTPLLKSSDRVGQTAIQNSPKEAEGTMKTPEFLYVGGDVMGLPRLTTSLVHAIHGKPDPAGIHALGFTSMFSVYTGYAAGKRGMKLYNRSEEIGDTTGKVIGAVNMVRAPMEIMGGLTFTPVRALSIAGTYTTAKSVAVATTTLATIGSIFYAGTYLLIAAPSAISLTKNFQFGSKLDEAMDQQDTPVRKARAGLNTLMMELDGTVEEKKEFLRAIAENPEIWDEEVPVDPGRTDHTQYTLEERRLLWNEAGEYTSNDFSQQRLYGHFKKHFSEYKAKKTAEFSRKTGVESVGLIRKELDKPSHKSLLNRLDRGEGIEEAQGIIDSVKAEMKKNKILHAGIIFFCLVGVFALIAGTVASGGTLGIAIAAAWVVSAIGMLAIDGYFLYQTLQSGDMDKKDKIAFFVSNVLLIMIAGTGMFFSGGLAPIIIGAVMLVLWTGVAIYSNYYWKFKKDEDENIVEGLDAPYRGGAHVHVAPKEKLA